MTNIEIIANLATIIAEQHLEISELKTEVAHLHHELLAKMSEADTPQTEEDYFLELMDKVKRGEISDATANQVWYEYINKQTEISDTPKTESTGSPIGDYRDGVGAWQTDCDDRYAVRTDSGEVVAYACPLGCEQTDCGWK